jgi:hypothetical protein
VTWASPTPRITGDPEVVLDAYADELATVTGAEACSTNRST